MAEFILICAVTSFVVGFIFGFVKKMNEMRDEDER